LSLIKIIRTIKQNHLLKKKVSILEYSIENIEPYFHALSSYLSRIDGMLKISPEKAGQSIEVTLLNSIRVLDQQLIDARKEKSIALSRLKLIGAGVITEDLREISNMENDFRQKIIFEKTLLTIEQLKEFRKKFKDGRDKFYKAIEYEFIKIHS